MLGFSPLSPSLVEGFALRRLQATFGLLAALVAVAVFLTGPAIDRVRPG